MLRPVVLLIVLLTAACSAPRGAGVSRAECLALAEAYRSHRWQPTSANVLHGPDADGVQVDTPDTSYQKPGAVTGWWVPGQGNEGVPYQWGGFATLEQFDQDIAAGKAAGDVYTLEKRRLLDAAVSRHATGIDCSGFISRCWQLPRSYSTRELAGLCSPLPSWDALQPGDILNIWNSHVVLFAGWCDPSHTRLIGYEAGVPPHWLVVRHEIETDKLRRLGFTPLRYRRMR
jgi:cell wall-associated NlpC family hydrolase